jgi:hypothetical protein
MFKPSVALTVITRWVPEELAGGVSDLEVWEVIRSRPLSGLRLFPTIHAKYFRFDDELLVGSANITERALGWAKRPNLELLVETPVALLANFEERMMAGSLEVDDSLVETMRTAVASVASAPRSPTVETGFSGLSDSEEERAEWFPRSRHVQHLYECYLGHQDKVISSVFEDGTADLAQLNIPPSLTRSAFNNFVAARLQTLPVVATIDARSSSALDRPSGQALLADLGLAELSTGCEEWDRISSWLLAFLPKRFRIKNTYTGPALERSQLIR